MKANASKHKALSYDYAVRLEAQLEAEIQEFQKMASIGPIGSHVFDAFIQTPHRFKTRSKLWRYCQLGVRSQTSDGKLLGYEELDPSGRSELKAMSYRAWLAAMRQGDNEVRTSFEASLSRTHDRTHARLKHATQDTSDTLGALEAREHLRAAAIPRTSVGRRTRSCTG